MLDIVINLIPKIISKNKEIYETIKTMFWFKMLDFTNLSIVLINKVLTKTYSWKNANKVSLSAQECFCEYFVYLKSSRSFYLSLLLTKICTFVIMLLLNFVNCFSMYCNFLTTKNQIVFHVDRDISIIGVLTRKHKPSPNKIAFRFRNNWQ